MHEPKPAGASPVDLSFGLVERLKSLKVLLGTDSPEVRGWAPAVRQEAQAAVNAAISALKQCGGENCMGRRAHGVTQWVTEDSAAARVAAERDRWRSWVDEAVNYVGCETWSPSLKEEGERLLGLKA